MGIRLVMESASRHAPEGLTWRERYALMVLAASAIDATRELPPGIQDTAELAARLRLSRTQLYQVLAALCEKGALVHLERGRNGVKAAYAIAPFTAGRERPGDTDAPPAEDQPESDPTVNQPLVENPLKGPGFRDPRAPAKGPGSETEGSRFNPLKGPGFRDPAPYIGVRGFKTGGRTPLPPGTPTLFTYALPTDPPEEGETPDAKSPAPYGTPADRHALAAEVTRTRPEWSRRSVLRALERPSVTERPWPLVAEAMRLMAADEATQHPGRLEHDGPWWPQAARKTRAASGGDPAPRAHKFDPDPVTRMCRDCKGPEVDKIHRHRHRRTA